MLQGGDDDGENIGVGVTLCDCVTWTWGRWIVLQHSAILMVRELLRAFTCLFMFSPSPRCAS